MSSTIERTRPQVRVKRSRRNEGTQGANVFVYAIAAVVVAVTIGPVLYGILSGFRTNTDLARDPSGWPDVFTLENYANILTGDRFWGYAINSVMIAVITTAIVGPPRAAAFSAFGPQTVQRCHSVLPSFHSPVARSL